MSLRGRGAFWTGPECGRTLTAVRRRELFPVDRGLQARMVLAAVLTPTVVVAALAACAWFLPLKVVAGVVVGAGIRIGPAPPPGQRPRRGPRARPGGGRPARAPGRR